MGGVNYMGGKRNAAKTRAKDMTRIHKGFFRKQKLEKLSKVYTTRTPSANKETEPIALSHALGRRDSRDSAPTISLHLKRSNSATGLRHAASSSSGRSAILDALDTTEPTCLRGLLDRVLATPDLAGLSTRKRKRIPPPPYTPAKRRREDARANATERAFKRHASPESSHSSFVMVHHPDHEDRPDDLPGSEDFAFTTFAERPSSPTMSTDDEADANAGFVANYRSSTRSDQQSASVAPVAGPLHDLTNIRRVHPVPRDVDWPENILEHKNPWKSIGIIMGLPEEAAASANPSLSNGFNRYALPLLPTNQAPSDLIADDDDGWVEYASSPYAQAASSPYAQAALSPYAQSRSLHAPFDPIAQDAPADEHASSDHQHIASRQDLSSRPPSSYASTSSHSLHTSIFRESEQGAPLFAIADSKARKSSREASRSSPIARGPSSLARGSSSAACESSPSRGFDDTSSRARPSEDMSSRDMYSRANEPATSPSKRSAPAGSSSVLSRQFPVLSRPSPALSRSSVPRATQLLLSSAHSRSSSRPTPSSSRPATRLPQDGAFLQAPLSSDPAADARSSDHDLRSSSDNSNGSRPHYTTRTTMRFRALSQLMGSENHSSANGAESSPADHRPRSRKPFYDDQESFSAISPLRIALRSPLQPPSSSVRRTHRASGNSAVSGGAIPSQRHGPSETQQSSPFRPPAFPRRQNLSPPPTELPSFTDTIPCREQLVHHTSSSPPRPSKRTPENSAVVPELSAERAPPLWSLAVRTSPTGLVQNSSFEAERNVQPPPRSNQDPGDIVCDAPVTVGVEDSATTLRDEQDHVDGLVRREDDEQMRHSLPASHTIAGHETPVATKESAPAIDNDLTSALLAAAGFAPRDADAKPAEVDMRSGPCLLFADEIEVEEADSDE
ncbi:hypothetical protein BD626DRAFT_627671 [Schizophyllum amplum]|uniref:Uncharacterized protein n=1 Tax=Schizophyllum amplum TaxID=97359 RepID=A0A550CLF3_9AGAR|nr:hypothetical protein BD626DRAFT_627671 [Auriculariopsis ampla]